MRLPDLTQFIRDTVHAWNVRRAHWKERQAIHRLDPRDVPDAERELLRIHDEVADPSLRRQEIHSLFEKLRDRIKCNGENIRTDVRDRYARRIEGLHAKILAPDFPVNSLTIDHALRREKARAMYNSEKMRVEVQAIPEVSNSQRMAAFFLMLLSYFGNYLNVQIFLGTDFLGSELSTMVATAVAAAGLTIGEVVALFIFMIFTGRYKILSLKVIGFASAVCLLVGLVMLILARTELAAVASHVPAIGFVE